MFQSMNTEPSRGKEYREYEPLYRGPRLVLPKELHIQFRNEDRGIKWQLQADYENPEYKSYSIAATINPKILGRFPSYIEAADYSDLGPAIMKFDHISRDISPILGRFDAYQFRRIDYCINFDLQELAPGCTVQQVMNLIKRSKVPYGYTEWKEYDRDSHRKVSKPNSFYLIGNTTNVNCYIKSAELQERLEKNHSKGFSTILLETADDARDIIRFEVQCKRPKSYGAERWMKQSCLLPPEEYNRYWGLLGFEVCLIRINYYYASTIGRGDWYSLAKAQKIIRSFLFNRQKEERLLEALREVSQCRGLPNAIKAHQGGDLEAFKMTLRELADLGINPVTIPREWNIARIPNLLHTFNEKIYARDRFPEPVKLV